MDLRKDKVLYEVNGIKRSFSSDSSVVKSHSQTVSQDSKKYKDRWLALQIEVLVSLWKEKFQLLKSSRSREGWLSITAAVNEISGGPERTLHQCKDKMRNLIAVYKRAKENNNKTGASPDFLLISRKLIQ